MTLNKKTKQRLALIGVIGMGLIFVWSIGVWLDNPTSTVSNTSESTMIKTGVQQLDPQEAWVHQTEQTLQQTQTRFEAMQQSTQARLDQLETLLNTFMTSLENQRDSAPSHPIGGFRHELAQHLHDLESENKQDNATPFENTAQLEPHAKAVVLQRTLFDAPEPTAHLNPLEFPPALFASAPPQKTPEFSRTDTPLPTSESFVKIDLALSEKPPSRPWIPATTIIPAALLGSVTASTSIQAPSEPIPVLLRLLDDGSLPREGSADLKDCRVIAAAYGDLASERIRMRLETLTCTRRETGERYTQAIKGYVAGEDGGAGLKAHLIDRSASAAGKTFLAGLFNSISRVLSPMAWPLGTTTASFDEKALSILKQSSQEGGRDALQQFAQFYIKRAEQLQPVLHAEAGRRVDLVLTAEVPFEDSSSQVQRPNAPAPAKPNTLFPEFSPSKGTPSL